MREFKGEDELKIFLHTFDTNPFQPNKVKYAGKIYIVLGGNLNNFTPNSYRYIEDYFHPEFFFREGDGFRVKTKLKIVPGLGKFSKKSQDTWVRVDLDKEEEYKETYDTDFYHINSQKILTQRSGGKALEVIIPEEGLLILGFVRGLHNPDFWFYNTEVDSIDMFLPYKKFENVYRLINTKKEQEKMRKSKKYDEATISTWVTNTIKDNIRFGVDSLTYSGFEGLDYTFGIEIETCIGRLEPKDYNNLNVRAVHDGSLRDAKGETPGGEYITGVLKGDSGLSQLYELCRVLSMKCKVNHLCGVHLHIGSLNWGKEDVVYAYALAEMIEKQTYNMLPSSRRNNTYCRPLTRVIDKRFRELASAKSKGQYNIIIDDLYDEIYKEVTIIKGKNDRDYEQLGNDRDGLVQSDRMITSRNVNKSVNHPLGSKCGYDKGAQRYCWMNFVTLLFDTKGNPDAKTLEIRSHSATMNYQKIKNWLKIFFAFCKFVEAHKGLINAGNVTLEDIVLKVYNKSGSELASYIKERTQIFLSKDESIDYIDEVQAPKMSVKGVLECA